MDLHRALFSDLHQITQRKCEMGLKKLVGADWAHVQVPYEWFDYILLPFRVVLLVVLLLIVIPLMKVGKLLNWLANHPAVQPFDRRDSR